MSAKKRQVIFNKNGNSRKHYSFPENWASNIERMSSSSSLEPANVERVDPAVFIQSASSDSLTNAQT